MKVIRILVGHGLIAAVVALTASAARAAPDSVVRQSVAVCDPFNPQNCLKPGSDGSLAVTGGGGGGGGGSSGPVWGFDASGQTPTKPPVLMGLLDSTGKVITPTLDALGRLPTANPVVEAGVGAPADAAAAVGGNGSTIAQLKQAVTQLSTQVTRLNTIITTLGSPFQAGGSIGNTSFGISGTAAVNNLQWAGTALGAPTAYGTAPTGNVPGMNAFVTNFPSIQPVSGTVTANQGTAAALANAWPTVLTQGGALLSSGNPIFAQITNPYAVTTTNALKPPTAAPAKIIEAICAIPAATSTALTTACTIVGGGTVSTANWTNAITAELQQPPTGTVNAIGISGAGATLTSAAGASKHLPATNSTLYTFAVVPTSPPTVYSAAAQNVGLTITLQ